MKQAEENRVTGKSNGSITPEGFVKMKVDGADFVQHFGQGAASKTPYMNWWVLSIYYLVDSGNIVMGIEEERYHHLNEMKIQPSRRERIGRKKTDIAVFYSTTKDAINYNDMYDRFLSVSEELMRLGMD